MPLEKEFETVIGIDQKDIPQRLSAGRRGRTGSTANIKHTNQQTYKTAVFIKIHTKERMKKRKLQARKHQDWSHWLQLLPSHPPSFFSFLRALSAMPKMANPGLNGTWCVDLSSTRRPWKLGIEVVQNGTLDVVACWDLYWCAMNYTVSFSRLQLIYYMRLKKYLDTVAVNALRI